MLCELLRLHGLGLSEIYLVICDLKGCSFCYECWKHKVTHLDQGQYCPIHVSCLCSCYIDPHPKWITMKSMIAHQHRVWAHKYCIVLLSILERPGSFFWLVQLRMGDETTMVHIFTHLHIFSHSFITHRPPFTYNQYKCVRYHRHLQQYYSKCILHPNICLCRWIQQTLLHHTVNGNEWERKQENENEAKIFVVVALRYIFHFCQTYSSKRCENCMAKLALL